DLEDVDPVELPATEPEQQELQPVLPHQLGTLVHRVHNASHQLFLSDTNQAWSLQSLSQQPRGAGLLTAAASRLDPGFHAVTGILHQTDRGYCAAGFQQSECQPTY